MIRKSEVGTVVALVFAFAAVFRCARPVENARILAVETIAAKSHWYFMSAVLESLTDAGHHVTVFTPFPVGRRENYTEVDTSERSDIRTDTDLLQTIESARNPFACLNFMSQYCRFSCNNVYESERLGEMLRTTGGGVKFDVILVEPLVLDCVSFLAQKLDAPVIYVIPSPMITSVELAFTGHLANPASVSHLLSAEAVPETFVQRFANTALFFYGQLRILYDEWTLKFLDPRPYDLPRIVHPSVIFQNSHYITEASRPVVPNHIYIGGIHLKPAKTIPKDILDFIEDSPHGVIYFTFGSTIKLSSLPEHIEKSFKNALAKVPQRVLWKYETEMNDMPKNVMIKKWFPQREILLHPKVKLFISHGGISGVYEAIDAGVPLLGFPLIFDQPRNIGHLVRAGMAMSMDLLIVTEDMLLNAISELINNEKGASVHSSLYTPASVLGGNHPDRDCYYTGNDTRVMQNFRERFCQCVNNKGCYLTDDMIRNEYIKNAKIASHLFKDRPMSPKDAVVYWTEYVIRHKGAHHLKSQALNLTWYQYFLLDVIAFALVFIFLTVFTIYKMFKVIYCYVFKRSSNNKIKTQ